MPPRPGTPWWKHLLELAAVLLGTAVAYICWNQLTVMSGQLQITQKQLGDFENVQAARLTIENFDLKVVSGKQFYGGRDLRR